jgi:hypothetical protein
MDQYSGYGKNVKLHSADKLTVHHAENGRVVILECEVHGTILATGVPYHNRLPSVITIGDSDSEPKVLPTCRRRRC